jgi:peptidoglycan/xylan/chitin deacetylase (PgdA/CDA1 family)
VVTGSGQFLAASNRDSDAHRFNEETAVNPKVSRRQFFKRLALGTGAVALSPHLLARAQAGATTSTRPRLPVVQPPGANQPVAPGFRNPAALPTLELGIPEVRKLEYASNGFIEVAHATILEPTGRAGTGIDLALAQAAVATAFKQRASLSEVDVSVYDAVGFDGFGGPPPRFTASVPRERAEEFARLEPGRVGTYDRAWVNPMLVKPPTRKPQEDNTMRAPTFHGSADALRGQQVKQLASQLSGGVRGGLYFHGNPAIPLAALSFDDAPHPLFEPLLLDTLRRANAKATFFCIGRNAVAYPYFVRDMVREGHEVGNHTFHHVRLPPLSNADVQDELQRCNQVLQGITGQPVRYFRPPGGDYSAATLRIASSLGLTTTFWTDDPADFDNPGDAILESRLTRRLRAGGIVLLHDNVLQSIQVLPSFLNVARQRRIGLVTVGRLDASDGQR